MFVYTLFSLLPFMAAFFWTVTIALYNINGWRKGFMPNLLLHSAVCTLLMLGQAVYYNVPDLESGVFDIISVVCRQAVYPVLFLFIKKITTSRGADSYDFLLLAPSFAAVVCAVVFRMTGSVHNGLLDWTSPVFLVVMLYVNVKSTIFIIRYNRQIRNFYSNTTRKTFDIMLWIMYLMLLSSVFSISMKLIGQDFFYGNQLWAVPSLLISMIIYLFFYEGIRIDFSAEDAASDQLDVSQILKFWKRNSSFIRREEIRKESIPVETNMELLEEMEKVIRERRMYRNPDLKITDVVNAVASNRTYVSNAINHGLKMSFSDYINRMRVEEAMSKLAEIEEGTPIRLVAEEVGFNNDATFYRHFRKVTGMTPADWMNKNKNKNINQ